MLGALRIAHSDDADLVGLDLEDPLDRPLERVLEGHYAIWLESKRLHGLDVERIGDVGGPELDEAELFLPVFISLGHGGSPIPGNQSDRESLVSWLIATDSSHAPGGRRERSAN
jgi:hypothetical protein